MNDFERGIINLVKSAIVGCTVNLSPDFDWNSAFQIAVKHQLIPVLYYGVINSEIVPPDDIMQKLEFGTFKSISVSTNQLYEIKKICEALINNHIDFMLLKGCVLKFLYPKPEMRSMGDADILIRTEQYDKIRPIILDLGFKELTESDHELIWNKNFSLHLEFHKRLIPSYNKDYYEYFGDGWNKALPLLKSTEYQMSDENNFIYLFTHYAKHYRDGGIGVRHLTDFYVFLNAKPDINLKFIEAELDKLQLLKFYQNTIRTLSVWFKNEPDSEITDFMTAKILNSGSYGTYDSHILSKAVKDSKSYPNNRKIKSVNLFNMIFLPFKEMKRKYTFLSKLPFLLPIMWVVRWITAIFFNRDRIKKQRDTLNLMSSDNISKYQKELNFVGLDFNFKE